MTDLCSLRETEVLSPEYLCLSYMTYYFKLYVKTT